MYGTHDDIETHLTQLRGLLSCEFAGLAWSENNIVRWKVVSGNRNDRYRKIILRSGKGIAGQVLRSGRPMTVDCTECKFQYDMKDFPIMLAEGLMSAAAVPVTLNIKVLGILLVGNRSPRTYLSHEIELVSSFAEQLGSLMQTRKENLTLQPINELLGTENIKEDLK
jgi:nitrogen regulatory protein A